MAFLLQLAGKVGSFVAASAGNDYLDAFYLAAERPQNRCRGSIPGLVLLFFASATILTFLKSRRQKLSRRFILFYRPVGYANDTVLEPRGVFLLLFLAIISRLVGNK